MALTLVALLTVHGSPQAPGALKHARHVNTLGLKVGLQLLQGMSALLTVPQQNLTCR